MNRRSDIVTTRNDPNERLSELLRTPAPGASHSGEPSATDRIVDKAEQVRDKAGEKVEQVRDKAGEKVEQVRDKAQEVGHEAAARVDSAMSTTGEKLSDAARTLRQNAPSGQAGDVAQGAARALERGGEYLRTNDVESVRGDLETLVREHPIQALAIGFGVGFMVARSMRPRRGSYYG
jgi:ElaB/YqjD/DUF883 family membrane-anchored ribosome-binding protein